MSPSFGDLAEWLCKACPTWWAEPTYGYGGFEMLAELIQREGVGRVCTDHSAETLQRLVVDERHELVEQLPGGNQCEIG